MDEMEDDDDSRLAVVHERFNEPARLICELLESIENNYANTIQHFFKHRIQPWKWYNARTARSWLINARCVLRTLYQYIATVEESRTFYVVPWFALFPTLGMRYNTTHIKIIRFWRQLLFTHNLRVRWWNENKGTSYAEVYQQSTLGFRHYSEIVINRDLHRMIAMNWTPFLNEYNGVTLGETFWNEEWAPYKSIWMLQEEIFTALEGETEVDEV